MSEVIHVCKFRIVQVDRSLRHAYLEGFQQPIALGHHGSIKHFYKIEPERDVPSTFDYAVAAVAG